MNISLCLHCNNIIPKHSLKFCNNQCQQDYKCNKYIEKWLLNEVSGSTNIKDVRHGRSYSLFIKRYLFKINNNSCSICKWSEKSPYTNQYPLEIDHIDGNRFNNRPENLRLLCPNCHSLTPTFRGTKRK